MRIDGKALDGNLCLDAICCTLNKSKEDTEALLRSAGTYVLLYK